MNLLHPLLVFLASLTQQELARQVVFLREENRILRSRLPGRVIATPAEKSRLIKLGRDRRSPADDPSARQRREIPARLR